MSKPNLILIGAGGHAHSCIDVIEEQGIFNIVGLIGLKCQLNTRLLGYEVIGVDSDIGRLSKIYKYALITVGQIQSGERRKVLYAQALASGFQFPPIISPNAYISRHAQIGDGTIVMHGVIVNAGANIGRNCIINSNALIEHSVNVGDNCHISTGAIVNGDVRIGSDSFIGSGSVIKQGVSVGDKCMVGMSLSLRHDLCSHKVFIDKA